MAYHTNQWIAIVCIRIHTQSSIGSYGKVLYAARLIICFSDLILVILQSARRTRAQSLSRRLQRAYIDRGASQVNGLLLPNIIYNCTEFPITRENVTVNILF